MVMDNKLETLPERPYCSNLSTLLLQRNYNLSMIHDLFFGCMQNLRVLDLHFTKITTLLSSFSCLTCLRALYLESCTKLMELPSTIEALQNLEVLDIRCTRIYFLPVEIGHLSQLWCLRISLSNTEGRSTNVDIYQNIVSRLHLLEELVIEGCSEDQWWNEVATIIAEDMATLTKLTSLSFCFPKVSILNNFITKCSNWKRLCFTFQFCVGQYHSISHRTLHYSEYEVCKSLKYVNGEGVEAAIQEVLGTANTFELIGNKGAFNLLDFGIKNLNKVRTCLIESCGEMITIIDGNGITKVVLQCLEKMYTSDLPNLESIWKGCVSPGSLNQLATIIFFKCPMLKNIFSKGLIQQLSNLQHLEVEDCEEIIIEAENNGLNYRALSSLKTLILVNLPRLRSI